MIWYSRHKHTTTVLQDSFVNAVVLEEVTYMTGVVLVVGREYTSKECVVVDGICRYFQHAHFIPIVGVGKRGAR